MNSSTQITATSPSHAAGTVDITVSTGGGTSATSPADQFTFASSAPPTVTGISPPSGSPGGQTTVTITGNNLTGATAVSFGSTAAYSFTVNSPTQITAISPAHIAGVVDITVTTANGTSLASTADKFTFGTPGVLTVVERYIHGDQPDQWFARVDSVVTWMLPDHLGSVRDLMNASGSIIDHIDYDAYGNTVNETHTNVGGRLKYAGGEFDIETGLYHFGARYYDAPIGRWLSEDPKGFAAGDSNLNRYVGNGPTDGTDPSGLADPVVIAEKKKKVQEVLKKYGIQVDDRLFPGDISDAIRQVQVKGRTLANNLVQADVQTLTNWIDLQNTLRNEGFNPEGGTGTIRRSGPENQFMTGQQQFIKKQITGTAGLQGAANFPPVQQLWPKYLQALDNRTTSNGVKIGTPVGEPGTSESLIPIWGSGREAINAFQTGHWGKAGFYGALAITDALAVKAIATAGAKVVTKEAVFNFLKDETGSLALNSKGKLEIKALRLGLAFKAGTKLDLTGASVGFSKQTYPKGTGYVYVLRDKTTGELLKVGKTSGGTNIYGRFNMYRRRSLEYGYNVEVEFWEAGTERQALDLEGQIRSQLKDEGNRLPWDKQANPGRNDLGLPWERSGSTTFKIEE